MTRERYRAKIAAKNKAISEIYAELKDDPKAMSAYLNNTDSENWAEKFKAEVSRVVKNMLDSDEYKEYGFSASRIIEIVAENYDLEMSNGDID